MKKLLSVLLVLAAVTFAQEKVTLNNAVLTDPGESRLKLDLLHLEWKNQLVVIHLIPVNSTNGIIEGRAPLVFKYEGTNAQAKMRILNTNNFSVSSLQRKCLIMLSNDFPQLTGVISGTVE